MGSAGRSVGRLLVTMCSFQVEGSGLAFQHPIDHHGAQVGDYLMLECKT
jgi:hypothetical protein